MEKSHVIIGGGGHALSAAEAALCLKLPILGYTAPESSAELAPGIPWLGTDEALGQLGRQSIRLINGLGSTKNLNLRRDTYLKLRDAGYEFAQVQHPSASISSLMTNFGQANQILAGAIINAKVTLGENVLINSRAVIEHGCQIGDHCHIASGAVLCGDVVVANEVHIGANATIIQGIKIGSGAVIAAGAVVTQNVEPLTLIAGVPGEVKRRF